MNINGIGAAGYPAAGYETKKAERNMVEGNFAEQAAEAAQATAALHGAEEGSGDITIFSWAEVVSGTSVSVYKTPDFEPENPVYKVKTWDKSGNATEQMVDVSKVDPKNCDTAEMYAYTANLKESGKGSFEDTSSKIQLPSIYNSPPAAPVQGRDAGAGAAPGPGGHPQPIHVCKGSGNPPCGYPIGVGGMPWGISERGRGWDSV